MHQTGVFSAWVFFKSKTFSKCVSKPLLLFPFSCFRLKFATYISFYTVLLEIAAPSNQLGCKLQKAQNVKYSLNWKRGPFLAHITDLQSASYVLKFKCVFTVNNCCCFQQYSRSGYPCSWQLIYLCSRSDSLPRGRMQVVYVCVCRVGISIY